MTSNRSLDNTAGHPATKTLVRAFQATSPSALPSISSSEKFDYQAHHARIEEASNADISDSSNSWKKMNLKFTALFAGRDDDDNDPDNPDSAAAKEERRKEEEDTLLDIMDAMNEDMQKRVETYHILRRSILHKQTAQSHAILIARDNYNNALREESEARDAVAAATKDVNGADVAHKKTRQDYTQNRTVLLRTVTDNMPAGMDAPDNRDISVETVAMPGTKDTKTAAWEKHGAAIDALYAKAGLTKALETLKDAEATKDNPTLRQSSTEDLTRATKAIRDAGLPISPDEALTRYLKENDPQNPYLKTLDAQISTTNDSLTIADHAEKFLADKHEDLQKSQANLQKKIADSKTAQDKLNAEEQGAADLEKELRRVDKMIAKTEDFQKKLPELKQALKDKTITPAEFLEQIPENMRQDFLDRNSALRLALEKNADSPATPAATSAARATASNSAAHQVYNDMSGGKPSLAPSFARAAHDGPAATPSTALPDTDFGQKPKIMQTPAL